MGFKDLSVFHFIDQPPEELVQEAEDELKFFQAVNVDGEITELGKKVRRSAFLIWYCVAYSY